MNTNSKTYAITAATGNIGARIARALLAEGQGVRVLTRDLAKVQDLVAVGAQAFVGASDDATYLTRAFRGVDAVFALTPPDYAAADFRAAQNAMSTAIATAITASGVRHVVNLSSVGAHLPSGTGPIKGLYDQERRLDALTGLNVLHLRPAYFMENLAFTLDPIKMMGIVGSPLRENTVLPMIATQDIAAVAVRRLLALDFSGSSFQELQGERDLTMGEVTFALAAATGKSLKYVQFPYDAAKEAMIAGGLSPDTADQMVEMNKGFNDGLIMPVTKRSAASTTPTSIEVFAKGFAALIG